MPLPLVGAAAAVAGRVIAKKVATEAAKKAAKKAAEKKAAQIASNSVKPVKAGAANAAKFNQGSMMRTTDAATGAAARKAAARLGVTGIKGVQPPLKINSAVKSSPATKATARGIAAANKPVSRKNAGQTASTLKLNILKNGTPARANRTRAGKKVTK